MKDIDGKPVVIHIYKTKKFAESTAKKYKNKGYYVIESKR